MMHVLKYISINALITILPSLILFITGKTFSALSKAAVSYSSSSIISSSLVTCRIPILYRKNYTVLAILSALVVRIYTYDIYSNVVQFQCTIYLRCVNSGYLFSLVFHIPLYYTLVEI